VFRETLIKSFDRLITNGKYSIPFVVSPSAALGRALSNALPSIVEGHERNQFAQPLLKRYPILIAALLIAPAVLAELRDPTLPGNLPPAQFAELPSGEAALNLTGIWISDTARRATINGDTVTAGQTLADGSRLLKIRPHYVLVRQNGVDKKLYLVPSVKKPVK